MTREAIVATALATIQDNGAAGLSLRDVARRLGVHLAAVQNHFATRDDLWRACVDQVLPAVLPGTGLPPDPGRNLRVHLRSQLERAAAYPGLTAAMWHDHDPGADRRQAYLLERCLPIIAAGRQQLDGAIAAGLVRPVDPGIVLALIGLGLSSLANAREPLAKLFGVDLADEQARAAFVAGLADLLLHGLLTEGDEARSAEPPPGCDLGIDDPAAPSRD